MKLRYGFTMIEILVVLVIIAILGAIAVPNFAKAKHRARVTRSQNDMQSIAIALEAYCLDNDKQYIPCSIWEPNVKLHNEIGKITDYQRQCKLTTPVAYLPDVIPDPFQANLLDPSDPIHCKGYYGYWEKTGFDIMYPPNALDNRWASGAEGSAAFNQEAPFGPDGKTKMWGIKSPGPDLIWNWADMKEVNPPSVSAQYTQYDPTNGTTSHGDIILMGPAEKIK